MTRTKDKDIVKKLTKKRDKARELNKFKLVAKLDIRLNKKRKNNGSITEWF